MGILGLSLVFRVLYEPKNNQNLCNIVVGVLNLKTGLMEYVLFCHEGIA
jgi:hypothetical protein